MAGRTADHNVAGRCRSYPILMKDVLAHFGQGGSLSSVLSKRTVSPQARHLYVPFPGFSPVVGIEFTSSALAGLT